MVSKLSAQATTIVAGSVATTPSVCWGNNEYGQATVPVGVVSNLSAQAATIVAGYVATTLSSAGETTRGGRPPCRTRSLKAEIVNNNPNNIPGYDPDIFYTEENDLSRFIKEEIVDRYAEDNPWVNGSLELH